MTDADEDGVMLKRTFDAATAAREASSALAADGKLCGTMLALCRQVLMQDTAYSAWFERYRSERGYSAVEASVHATLVSERLFGAPARRGSAGELAVEDALLARGVRFTREHTPSGLVHNGPLRLDFFLLDLNAAIEFNGEQHYRPIGRFGGVAGYKATVLRDETKRRWCEAHGVRLLAVRFDDDVPLVVEAFMDSLV